MRVALGSDHAGFELKERLRRFLDGLGVACDDFGCSSPESVDYPDIAAAVARRVADGSADRGILICGTGIGMAIAANKIAGVRAAPCYTPHTAALSRGHNDANVLTLGARLTEADAAAAIVRAFIDTPFDGGRHQRRVDKIGALERDGTPESREPKAESPLRESS
ncbi:MAG: ribose 5-phosphate isomerase B [Bacteroidales bacterium]